MPPSNMHLLGPDNASTPYNPASGGPFLPTSSTTATTAAQNATAPGLDTDPNVLASLALQQQGLSQLDANLKNARERAIIQFGDPALASEAGFGLDPQAGAFAQQNYMSGNAQLSRLDKQHDLARQAIINRLAAHGILQSGDLGYQEGQENQSYGNQVYDARQSVLDYLAGLMNTYNQQRQALSQSVIGARQQAIQNFLSNPDAYTAAFGG